MVKRVRWTKTALRNFEQTCAYLQQENPQARQSFVAEVAQAIELLSHSPSIGRAGRVAGTRELMLKRHPYLIPYRVKDQYIEILRLFHTHRKPFQ